MTARKKKQKEHEQDLTNSDSMDLDFTDFSGFLGDESEGVRAELIRISPKTFQGVGITGFIRELVAGETKQNISDQYGGGKYRIVIKSVHDGKIRKSQKLEIAGYPKLATPEVETVENDSPEVMAKTITMDGVTINSDSDFFGQLKQVIAMKALLKDSDPNIELMKAMLSRDHGGTDTMGLIRDVLPVISELKEFFGGGGEAAVGSNFSDIIREAIGAFKVVMQNKAQIPARDITLPPISPGGRIATAITTPEIEDNRSIENGAEEMKMQTRVNQAVYMITQNYRLEKTASETIELLTTMVDIPEIARKQISSQKHILLNLAEMELIDLFEADGDREKFVKYFNEVFSKVIDKSADSDIKT